MSVKDLVIAKVAEENNLSKAAAGRIVASFLGAVEEIAKDGEKVSFHKFGTFSLKTRESRDARNPQTGKKMKTKPYDYIAFKTYMKYDK